MVVNKISRPAFFIAYYDMCKNKLVKIFVRKLKTYLLNKPQRHRYPMIKTSIKVSVLSLYVSTSYLYLDNNKVILTDKNIYLVFKCIIILTNRMITQSI